MPFQAVVFDLDGTLLDTLTEIATAANRALADGGYPTHPTDAFRRFVGDGMEVLFRRALPAGSTEEQVAEAVAAYRAAYTQGADALTFPYEDIPELLDALVGRGVPMAVLSNKKEEFVRRCVAEALGRWPFAAASGDRPGLARKPDPAGALEVARRLGVGPASVLYLGDTDVDMKTARAAGMRAIGVGWGFRPREELLAHGAEVVIDHPLDLLPILDGTVALPGPASSP